MYDKECVPFAPSLIESMRSLGYSFPAAIADLIDNSISAKSKKIDIIAEPGPEPQLIILDDGTGMTKDRLYEAMRYGSSNPLDIRSNDDLGRFGLGLKSASLSQCRTLTVVSKCDGRVNAFSWDLNYVIASKQWLLRGFSEDEISQLPHIEDLYARRSGTYVLLTDFDRIKEGTGNIAETYNKYLDEMANHIALVFHRFISDGLEIRLNNGLIEGKDPFLSYHHATQRKKESQIYINNEKIVLKPFILPHLSKLSQSDLDRIGGKEKLRNEQGFYVYRNKRLIVWGTWFRLERKAELNKLARVRVDIPNTLDYMWSIDIKKSTAVLPDIIKQNMYSAVYDSVISSEAVHTYRGRKERKGKEVDYIWERVKTRNGYQYNINRCIPQLKILVESMDENQVKMLNSVLDTLEEAFPVASLYVDAAKGEIEEKNIDENEELIEKLWAEIQQQIDYVKEKQWDVASYYKAFIKVEPYCNYQTVKERIIEELKRYE